MFFFFFLCTNIHYCLIYSLFYGYDIPINISSIRIIETATNYRGIIQAITFFDNVLSNNIYNGVVVNTCPEWSLILNHLMHGRKENIFDPIIYNSWKVFLEKKLKLK